MQHLDRNTEPANFASAGYCVPSESGDAGKRAANATGSLPLSGDQKEAFSLDGKSLAQNSRLHSKGSNGQEVYEVPSGSYQFEVTLR